MLKENEYYKFKFNDNTSNIYFILESKYKFKALVLDNYDTWSIKKFYWGTFDYFELSSIHLEEIKTLYPLPDKYKHLVNKNNFEKFYNNKFGN